MKIILTEKVTFKYLIEQLDYFGMGFLAIVDKENTLVGILTDGDVRRAILNDVKDVESIFNKNPVIVPESMPKKKVITLLKTLHRKHMPVVDSCGRLVEVITLDDIEFNQKPNHVIIMAGGLGTRLGELTKNTPKPMLNIGDKPMIVHIIEAFKDYGYNKFTLSVNYKSEYIKEYFKDGSDLGVDIDYIEETKRLGTGGALSLLKQLPKDPFFVINGDVLTSLNFERLMSFHINSHSSATMCVRNHEIQIPYGIIKIDQDNNIRALEEKPLKKYLINSGIYVFDPEVINLIPTNEYFDMPSLFESMISKGMTAKTYESSEFWIDIGSLADYKNANDKLSENK